MMQTFLTLLASISAAIASPHDIYASDEHDLSASLLYAIRILLIFSSRGLLGYSLVNNDRTANPQTTPAHDPTDLFLATEERGEKK
jgi:hypothetical protein